MAKLTKSELSVMGKKIIAKAKEIRRANPGKPWKTCMKEAAQALKEDPHPLFWQK